MTQFQCNPTIDYLILVISEEEPFAITNFLVSFKALIIA